jgi:hypothetical protein
MVGIPGESEGNVAGAGGVEVLGIDQTWGVGFCLQMAFPYVIAAPHDGLGSGLASGDFNADGFTDIAVGIPYREIDQAADAGLVYVTYPRYWQADLWYQGN